MGRTTRWLVPSLLLAWTAGGLRPAAEGRPPADVAGEYPGREGHLLLRHEQPPPDARPALAEGPERPQAAAGDREHPRRGVPGGRQVDGAGRGRRPGGKRRLCRGLDQLPAERRGDLAGPDPRLKAAIRWIRANAAKYGLDPDRIGVIGASAGGHLAAMLGTGGGSRGPGRGRRAAPRRHSRVRCVVDLFGPSDLPAMGTIPAGSTTTQPTRPSRS